MKPSVIPLLISLYPLVSALVSMVLAQFMKSLFCYLHDGKVDLKKWFSSGGMPSSHSAMVSSLSTAIGLKEGFTSSSFCICIVFSLIVLYDAAGVRQVVGKQAIILNHILDDFVEKGELKTHKIKELLGHTPFEVLMGVLLGIGTAFTLYY